ncbi:hypothetical protein A3E39_04200 [Candidatus Uhrbacteria bacterium RIFCSPHIGHO2_12_FULL_60_25]|uniref:Uncharacterized protein n=1 Tax=Candidatus Uhrbacteria bacterium RIFCSPHIGHO2_12_FULL_60_25 TaxID=1802399 RepID=A0A1F7ULI0_9BACT|nr:MAG: hypothetical protein A3D73_01225 [Candidatus Uhrbacteria bacterium RIFCSPHIGHO2_02_FULL_60_44]OGL79136.1 MAG: hypothetical protein A3E39_04200 [Candidatus Uhrbacteria bacterium RIFCSPHIGHO2_12_FULL_60_25]
MTTFFGFAMSDTMFAGDCEISRRQITADEARELIAEGITSCCNPSHAATIATLGPRFGITVPIPETPPRVVLAPGDRIIVMSVRGLPRMTDRHEYTAEEVASATFVFSIYTVR